MIPLMSSKESYEHLANHKMNTKADQLHYDKIVVKLGRCIGQGDAYKESAAQIITLLCHVIGGKLKAPEASLEVEKIKYPPAPIVPKPVKALHTLTPFASEQYCKLVDGLREMERDADLFTLTHLFHEFTLDGDEKLFVAKMSAIPNPTIKDFSVEPNLSGYRAKQKAKARAAQPQPQLRDVELKFLNGEIKPEQKTVRPMFGKLEVDFTESERGFEPLLDMLKEHAHSCMLKNVDDQWRNAFKKLHHNIMYATPMESVIKLAEWDKHIGKEMEERAVTLKERVDAELEKVRKTNAAMLVDRVSEDDIGGWLARLLVATFNDLTLAGELSQVDELVEVAQSRNIMYVVKNLIAILKNNGLPVSETLVHYLKGAEIDAKHRAEFAEAAAELGDAPLPEMDNYLRGRFDEIGLYAEFHGNLIHIDELESIEGEWDAGLLDESTFLSKMDEVHFKVKQHRLRQTGGEPLVGTDAFIVAHGNDGKDEGGHYKKTFVEETDVGLPFDPEYIATKYPNMTHMQFTALKKLLRSAVAGGGGVKSVAEDYDGIRSALDRDMLTRNHK